MTRRRARPALLDGEDLLPQPRQKRSEEKRAHLKAAALALFGERGYERTSIGDVATRAGLAVGGFYQHFRSKRQLLLALMDDLLANLAALDLQPGGSSPDVRAGLRRLLGRAASTDLHYAGAYRAWQEAVMADTDLAVRQRAIQAWTTSRVATAFSLLSQRPGARPGIDVEALARVMDDVFWGLLGQLGRLSRKERDRAIDAATHLVYHALFLDPQASGAAGPSGPRAVRAPRRGG